MTNYIDPRCTAESSVFEVRAQNIASNRIADAERLQNTRGFKTVSKKILAIAKKHGATTELPFFSFADKAERWAVGGDGTIGFIYRVI